MILFNALPQEDKKLIESYAKRFSFSNFNIGLESFLHEWDKEKRKLYHLLGNKFIYEFPYNFSDTEEVSDLIDNIFYNDFLGSIRKLCNLKKMNHDDNYDFFKTLLNCLLDEKTFKTNSFHNISSTKFLYDDKGNKILSLSSGMKMTKLLKKLVPFCDCEDNSQESFENFRIEESMIVDKVSQKGTMCISIHPLDYMTMSDNDNGWTSCMSWKKCGCYKTGTVEMMNSNCTLVVYSKSDKKLTKIKRGETWNSKTWRTLCIFTKHAIISGKHYPNSSDIKVRLVLEKLKELAKENLGWIYEEEIKDYNYWNVNHTYYKYKLKTSIMYNDFDEDEDYSHYFIVERNSKFTQDKNFCFSFSGKAYCLECGKRLLPDKEPASSFICCECIEKKSRIECPYCGYHSKENEFIKLDSEKDIKVCACCYRNNIYINCVTGEEIHSKEMTQVYYTTEIKNLENRIFTSFVFIPTKYIDKLIDFKMINTGYKNGDPYYFWKNTVLNKGVIFKQIKEKLQN